MIPVIRTYRHNPAYLRNIYNDKYCGGSQETYNQKVNVLESENNYRIDIVAPGYSKEEISVTIDKNELTIASINQEEAETNKELKIIRREFIKDKFSRTFKLPENAESEKIEATHKNGILSIVIPKKAKVEIPVQNIEVK